MTLLAILALVLQQPEPPKEPPKDDGVQVTATFKDGLRLAAVDGSFDMTVAGHLVVNARSVAARPDDATRTSADTFYMRQARIELYGTWHKDFEFKVMPDFATGTTSATTGTLMDAYVGWKRWKEFSIRIGQFKEPFGQEETISDPYTDFIERGISNRLVPSRDIGILVYGTFGGGLFSYQAGAYNGTGRSLTDTNDEKDAVLRLRSMPFAGADDSPFKSLRLGIAGTYGDIDSSSMTTSGDLVTPELGLMFLDATAGAFDGIRTRLGFEVSWTLGAFTVRGEYMLRTDEIDVGAFDGEEVDSSGWCAAVCWVLTGESKPLEGRLAPAKAAFDDGGFGAVEIAVRVSQLEVDDEIFTIGVAPAAGNSPSAIVYTFGVNWQLHRTIRVMADVILETFEDEVTFSNGDTEDQFIGAMVRFQFDF